LHWLKFELIEQTIAINEQESTWTWYLRMEVETGKTFIFGGVLIGLIRDPLLSMVRSYPANYVGCLWED